VERKRCPRAQIVLAMRQAGSGTRVAALVMLMATAWRPCAARTVYVNNVRGSDQADGLAPRLAAGHAPVLTLAKAVSLLRTSDTMVIANTGKPYRGAIHLFKQGGTPARPLVIEGNGAIIEGLGAVRPEDWRKEPDGLLSTPWGHWLGFAAFVNGRVPAHMVEVKSRPAFADVAPGTGAWCSDEKRGYFRLPQGKALADLRLELPYEFNGVTIHESSYVTVRNLHVRYFADDGFNEAGVCEGLVFENVEASYNGDQGMSAHNAVSATVRNAHFHHNHDGIADTQYSQTMYHGLRVHDNWRYGALFQGGYHLVTDAELRDNADGFVFEPLADASAYGAEHNPLGEALGRLVNVYVRGGASGLAVRYQARVSVEHASFVGNDTGVLVAGTGVQVHMVSSLVAHSRLCEMAFPGTGYFGGYNLWSTGRVQVQGQPETLPTWAAGKGVEEHSVYGDPKLVGGVGPGLAPDSPARGKAYWSKAMASFFKGDGLVRTATEPYSNADIGARFGGDR
jgi:hypothetical protein